LKPGDRVRLANGIPLASADDVMGAVLTPLIANQQVRLSGTRDGQAREMLLLNAGTCP
jgi:S1-C subfamily serine protease